MWIFDRRTGYIHLLGTGAEMCARLNGQWMGERFSCAIL